jgi:hypothetical protein
MLAPLPSDVETTGRQAEALRREIEELMVEDKTMSMTEIKVFNNVPPNVLLKNAKKIGVFR